VKDPLFSIAIPTKNRADRLRNAVRSVLAQTFDDLEVIVCDNSDEDQAAESAAVARSFDDPRIRYIRTSGQLSMADNWEQAVASAQGRYVGVLTDRSVYRRHAMETAYREIERTGSHGVSWFADMFGRDPNSSQLKRRECSFRRYHLSAESIFDFFLNGHPKFSAKIVPKLMTGVFGRAVLDEIRASPVGRCCPPVCPDFTSGFLFLAFAGSVLTLDEALYVSCGAGNGSAFRSRGDLGERFRRDLGMSWVDMVDRMPSAACFSHALVTNDLLRLRDAVPERFPSVGLNRVQYYVGCLNDYVKTKRHGISREEDLGLLLAQLDTEPTDVQEEVKSTRVYLRSVQPAGKAKAARVKPAPADGSPGAGFATVFDALSWDEENPRTPCKEGFLDSLPSVEAARRPRFVDRVLNKL